MGALSRFRSNEDGNVAMIVAIALMPIIAMTGSAVDYTRSATARSKLQTAVDSTALALAREADGLSDADIQKRAESYVQALYKPDFDVDAPKIVATRNTKTIKVTGTSAVPTTVLRAVGFETVPISAEADSVWAMNKIEVSLVLDNTGSMGAAGKMTALKDAVSKFMDTMDQIKAKGAEVKVGIVPFDMQVRMDPVVKTQPWLRWNVDLSNPSISATLRKAPTPATWGGCVSDRDQDFDVVTTAPNAADPTKYVASKCVYGPVQMRTLTTDLASIRATATTMAPNGTTNVTIGLTTGMALLDPTSPLGSTSATGKDTLKFLLLLTDGDNTMNRWTGNGSAKAPAIDDRLKLACDNARKTKVRVFTIRVIDGNGALLQSCATTPSDYYDVKNASELVPVFQRIADEIAALRLSA
jgi:Flp pilus assembly protein TadG